MKLEFLEQSVYHDAEKQRLGNLTIMQQSYCHQRGRLSDHQLTHPIVAFFYPLIVAIKTATLSWIKNRGYVTCTENVSMRKFLFLVVSVVITFHKCVLIFHPFIFLFSFSWPISSKFNHFSVSRTQYIYTLDRMGQFTLLTCAPNSLPYKTLKSMFPPHTHTQTYSLLRTFLYLSSLFANKIIIYQNVILNIISGV